GRLYGVPAKLGIPQRNERPYPWSRRSIEREGGWHTRGSRSKQSRSVGKDRREVPDARLTSVQAQQDARLRATFGGEPLSGLAAEVASCDRFARRGHVAFDEFRDSAHLDPAKRRDGLEYDERAPFVAG